MYLYSFGGFPFDPDMKPTVNSEAGKKAIEVYLRDKEVAFPDSPSWGTSQMIPHIAAGDVFGCQYWGGLIKLCENPAKSKTAGKWTYGRRAGRRSTTASRSIAPPACRSSCLLVNRHSPRKEAAAYMALWLGTEKSARDDLGPGQHVP